MLYKTLVAFSLISISSSSFAVPVTLPSKEVLQDRLNALGMDDFIRKTTLIEDLSDQEKEPRGVVLAVDLSLYDYVEDLPQIVAMTTMINRNLIIKAILKDNPDALEELKSHPELKLR